MTAGGARVRAEAARTVDAVVSQGRSLDAAMSDAEERTPPADRPLLRMLSFGTLRFHWRLRWYLALLLEKPLKSRDSVIESLLAVGLYQLTGSRVPDHAAVTLTVDAAKLLRRPKYAGLINAVLRNFARRGLQHREPEDDVTRFNHPAWLIERVRGEWPDHWERILDANNARAPMWLRVNSMRTSVEGYLAELRESAAPESGAQGEAIATTLAGFDQALRLTEPRPVAQLPRFGEGWVSVQDAAAQLAAPWLLGEGATRILDACAAPGGKTAHLLELSGKGTALIAIDSNPARLPAIADNLQRIGVSATIKTADASRPEDWWDGECFERILLDAPCSATGVIRRHPDIKLLRRETDIDNLARLQQDLLQALWPLLAPGGRLLYATCSVLATENETVVDEFLQREASARERQLLPNNNIRDLMHRRVRGFQVLPGDGGLDGFYYAALEKTALNGP